MSERKKDINSIKNYIASYYIGFTFKYEIIPKIAENIIKENITKTNNKENIINIIEKNFLIKKKDYCYFSLIKTHK